MSGEARGQEKTTLSITLQEQQQKAAHTSNRLSILGVRSLVTCEDTAINRNPAVDNAAFTLISSKFPATGTVR